MHRKTGIGICIAMCLAGCSVDGAAMNGARVQRHVSLLSGDILEVIYTLPEPVIETPRGDAPGQVRLSGEFHTTGPSRPNLALMESRILLPAGYEVDRPEVIVEGESQIPSKWFAYATGDVQRYAIEPREDGQAEGTGGEGNSAHLVGVYHRRGASIAVINIFPVRFDGDSGTLAYLTSLRLRLHLRPSATSAALPYRADPYRPIEAEVDNPEMLASYEGRVNEPVAGKLCQAGMSVDYVIITSAELASQEGENSLAELTEMKAAAGLSTAVVTIEQIDEAFEGEAKPEKIRQFIREAYVNWGTDFVLLGGDATVVPVWRFRTSESPLLGVVSDMYYQCLDGDFTGEVADGVGEAAAGSDWLAEVYVGRVPIGTAEEMSNWIAKLNSHGEMADDAGPRRALLIGDNLGLGGDADWAKPQLEQIRLGGVFSGIATQGFDGRSDVSVDVLYDQDRVCPHYEGWEIRNQLNANDYLAVHSLGHGSADNVIKMDAGDIADLTNGSPFFAYIAGCYGGDYGQKCAAGRLMGGQYGAVGLVAYSGAAVNMPGDVHSYSQLLSRYFWDAALGSGCDLMGVVNAASHERSLWAITYKAQRYVILSSNYLGDPAMPLGLSQKK